MSVTLNITFHIILVLTWDSFTKFTGTKHKLISAGKYKTQVYFLVSFETGNCTLLLLKCISCVLFQLCSRRIQTAQQNGKHTKQCTVRTWSVSLLSCSSCTSTCLIPCCHANLFGVNHVCFKKLYKQVNQNFLPPPPGENTQWGLAFCCTHFILWLHWFAGVYSNSTISK